MTTIIISTNDLGDARRNDFEESVAALLRQRGLAVLVTPPIYHVSEDDEVWAEIAKASGPVIALSWLYPRPAEWLFRRHGAGCAYLRTYDLGAYKTPRECADACTELLPPAPAEQGTITRLDRTFVKRWYPVIDYSRCVNCGQCLQFCLFGVYALQDERVSVMNPDNCKPGCPACSRVCPRGAIMFPLYDDEAIAGAPGRFVTPDDGAKAMYEKRTRRPYQQPADVGLDALIDDLDRLTEGRP